MTTAPIDVSVLLPFSDDEDIVGTVTIRLAHHLRELGLRFEFLAIEENSGDNSHAILGLLRKEIPELTVLYAKNTGRYGQGYATGAAGARGRVVWLIEPQAALGSLALFAQAFQTVSTGTYEAVIARGAFAVCDREQTRSAIRSIRGRRLARLRRQIERRRHGQGRVKLIGQRFLSPSWLAKAETRPLGRLLHAFSSSWRGFR